MGPAALALRHGVPIFPVCVYRMPDDSYQVEGRPLIVGRPTGDQKADEARVTRELLAHIEDFIRNHPEQWHVPHRIWEGGP
jgi:KDO2-lipid IV(A) lauroyltransferase